MKLSIITVNFNHREGLRNTINSVISQKDFDDYEFIVIDGGSTDGSKDVIMESANRITYWVSEKDGGIYNGMNKGIKVANGEYLIFMNSGDTFYNDHVLADVFCQNREAEIILAVTCSRQLFSIRQHSSRHLTLKVNCMMNDIR